jgi:hypothetical protein
MSEDIYSWLAQLLLLVQVWPLLGDILSVESTATCSGASRVETPTELTERQSFLPYWEEYCITETHMLVVDRPKQPTDFTFRYTGSRNERSR